MSAAAGAVRRLDALFRDVKLEGGGLGAGGRRYSEVVEVTQRVDRNCEVHGRRGSLGLALARRGSLEPPPTASLKRRDSLAHASSPRDVVLSHPAAFPGTLRKDSLSLSKRRFSTDSLDGFRRNSWDPSRRGSSSSSGGYEETIIEDVRQDKPIKVPPSHILTYSGLANN
jgi:hypothetical protein